MEPTHHELAPARDTAAESELAELVAENRQPGEAQPAKASFTHLADRLQAALEQKPEDAAERERVEAGRAELRRKAEMRQRFHDLLIAAGQRYRECTLDSFACASPQQQKIVSILREYVAKDCPEGLILFGPVGTGKDHLAFAVCREALRAGKTLAWINGQKWFGIVRDAMDTDRSERSLIDELKRPELLCLSDPLPPVGPLTQFQATMLYRLIDARYANGKPTICTINVASDQEADERMGAATWDRLTDGAYKLSCNWPSHRKASREA